jgi:hypothetical protein
MTATPRALLLALANIRETVVMLDHNGVFSEVVVGQYNDTMIWDSPALFDSALDVIQLG